MQAGLSKIGWADAANNGHGTRGRARGKMGVSSARLVRETPDELQIVDAAARGLWTIGPACGVRPRLATAKADGAAAYHRPAVGAGAVRPLLWILPWSWTFPTRHRPDPRIGTAPRGTMPYVAGHGKEKHADAGAW